jgi:hypothetical protein
MKRLGPACALMLVALANAAVAQGKPDFSGRWVLVTPRNEGFARELTVSYGIEERSRILSVERQYATNVHRDTYKFGVSGGGVSGGVTGGSGSVSAGATLETRFSVTWNYDRLVILTSRDSGPTRDSLSHTEYNETWSLDAKGQLVILATDRAPASAPVTTALTYRRR